MTTKVPQHVKSTRAQTLHGVTYSADQVLTAAQVLALPHLSALLSNGRLAAVPDMHERRHPSPHTPTNIPPVILKSMTHDYDPGAGFENQLLETVTEGHRVTLTITGGQAPYTVDWGDLSDPELLDAQVGVHLYTSEATFGIVVVGDEGDTYPTKNVVIGDFTIVATAVGLDVTVVPTGGREPWTSVVWGDDSFVGTDLDLTHTYGTADTFTVVLTDADGFAATDNVTTT